MQFTEPADILDQKTADEAKALKSLMEEVEAVNYYNQRVAATPNAEPLLEVETAGEAGGGEGGAPGGLGIGSLK
jgi:hypothetical protein